MSVDLDNILLMTGDIEGILGKTYIYFLITYSVKLGFVSLWDIENYCVSTSASYPPKRMSIFVVGSSVCKYISYNCRCYNVESSHTTNNMVKTVTVVFLSYMYFIHVYTHSNTV